MRSSFNSPGPRRHQPPIPTGDTKPWDTFRRLFSGLRDEVRSSKHNARFREAQARHTSLLEHDTVASVLAVLTDGRARYAEKDRLTRAVITERQAGNSMFWAAVALVGYYPMLNRLRQRVHESGSADDLDQLIVTSFLGVVTEYPLDVCLDQTGMRLQDRTEREVVRALCAEQDELRLFRTDQEEHEHTPWLGYRRTGTPVFGSPFDIADIATVLLEDSGDLLDSETLHLVVTTLLTNHRIAKCLDVALPELDPLERRRAEQRTKRRHRRALARIESALEQFRGH